MMDPLQMHGDIFWKMIFCHSVATGDVQSEKWQKGEVGAGI